ncbi:hypothetical protein ACHAAC_03425 [Aeromicrobium sp. CF4.19]|uniref:hypothetical protein n=1 Tax=Aeromicrobium sp. CF4.19 TaxID=3373082 RepID=UPI003EE62BC0
MRLITEGARDWVVDGVRGSSEHPSDAPFAVVALLGESEHPLRQYLGVWAVLGCTLGGFLVSAGIGSTDATAATVLTVAGLVLLLVCGTGGWVLVRTGRAVSDALLWWAELDDALVPDRSWRRAGLLPLVVGTVAALAALLGWFGTALALSTGNWTMVPFMLAIAVSFNVAAATILRHALRRSRVTPHELPDVEGLAQP